MTLSSPAVGVGAVIVHEGRAVLIQRGKEPLRGRWVIPGGTVELGETLEQAVVREVLEETGLRVRPAGVVLVFDRILRDESGVRYHYVIIDYRCEYAGGELRRGVMRRPPPGYGPRISLPTTCRSRLCRSSWRPWKETRKTLAIRAGLL